MALRKRPIAAGISALLLSGYVSALGLGEISLNSALNEPLDAEIPLLNLEELTEDEIIAGLASREDFVNAGVEKGLILTGLKFRLDLSGTSGPVIRVTSQRPIREPYLDFLVDVQWPAGRLLREYTLLLDLPVYAGGTFSKKKSQPIVAPKNSWGATPQAPATSSSDLTTNQTFAGGTEEYLVREGDTLWGISRRLSGDQSIHQKLTAIHQLNPEAFINNDINLLKKGAVLRLPEFSSAASGAGMASEDSSSSYDAPLSGSSRSSAAPQASDASGRLSLSAHTDSDSQGNLLGGTGSGSAAVRGEIASIQEELDRSRRENNDLKSRLSSLESQLGTIQRILELEDDNLRAAQLSSLQKELVQEESAAPESSYQEDVQPDSAALYEAEQSVEEDSPSLALFPSANERRAALGGDLSGNQAGIAPSSDFEDDVADGVKAESPDQIEESEETLPVLAGESGEVKPVIAPNKMELNNDKGWVDKVSGYLSFLLGLVVIAIGVVVVFVLRKKGKSQEYDAFEDFSAPHEPAPQAPVKKPSFEPAPAPEAASIDEIDLHEGDDLFAAEEPEVVTREAGLKPAGSRQDFDDELANVDLEEFDLPEEEPVEPQAAPQPVEELNLDEEFDFLGDVDEGDTQLELAQAYLEMGDQGGAREILQEVIEDGTAEQKAKARQMLEQLG